MLRDVLGQHATDDLLNRLNELCEQLKIIGWKEVRPWNEFFATFKTPQYNLKHLEQRITTNYLFYRSNYVLLCAIILCIQIIRAPVVCLTLVLIATTCTYFLIIAKGSIKVGDIEINETAKQIGCAAVTLLLLAVSRTLEVLLWSVLYCIAACGLHMIFRPRNITSKTNKIYEEAKASGFNVFGAEEQSGKSSRKNVFGGFENRFGGSGTGNTTNVDPENPPMNYYADVPITSSKSASAAYFPLSSAAARPVSYAESKTADRPLSFGGSSKTDSGVNYSTASPIARPQQQQQSRPISSSAHSSKKD